ncbi:MAG: DNA mismatch repair protein MutS [bacterium TMED217]|nr:MAG: DNA mismatch repair protein MutS [bacterium TMED217]
MKQYAQIKSSYPDSILLFRMGDFYETFGEDAVITSKLLGIVLTKRANGKASDVELAGFPYHSLDNYLPKLVTAGYKVAICEQVEDPRLVKGIVKREVIEVISPGTITSDQVLSQKNNNYIASIVKIKDLAGISIIDSSTGEFFVGECAYVDLSEYLTMYFPSEVVISKSLVYNTEGWYQKFRPFITSIEEWIYNYDQSYRILIEHFMVKSLKGFGCDHFNAGIVSAGALLYHLKNNLNASINHFTKLTPIQNEGFMGLDGYTIKNLEIFNSLSTQGTHGTLIDTIDYTVTAGGGRLLKKWLFRPLTDKKELENRLDIVEIFLKEKSIMTNLRDNLKQTDDVERIITKVNKRIASPRDLIGLSNTFNIYDDCIKDIGSFIQLNILKDTYSDLKNLKKQINNNINEDCPVIINKGNVIKTGVSKELDEYRNILNNGKEWINNFQNSEREKYSIPSLKVGFNKVFGYYIEITKTHQDKVPESYIRKQTLVNSERYITESLKIHEEKVLNAESHIFDIENKLFQDLIDVVIKETIYIQNNAIVINRIDVMSSFSYLALSKNYIRPSLEEDSTLDIINGRHPVIEDLLPPTEKFIPNDLKMNIKTSQIHLITGPNMAGKSTFLRQTAIIVLLAQIGSFVPAKSAKIGIVDRLFTRVGASDNLAGGESTFLVEMNEAANILNNVSSSSLVLFDEVGRGTATFDGLSIAWAIVEHLHETENIAARTLFATHYHELSILENKLDRLNNFHVEVREHKDQIVFLRKIIKGSGDKSYGIQVAKMAGLPNSIIKRAKEILSQKFENNDELIETLIDDEPIIDNKIKDNFNLLIKEIQDIRIDEITPIEALTILNDIKKKYSN